MEILTAIINKMEMGSKRYTTLWIVFFMALSTAFIATKLYHNSTSQLLEGSRNDKVFEGSGQNVTTKGLEGERVQNMTQQNLDLEGRDNNITAPMVEIERSLYFCLNFWVRFYYRSCCYSSKAKLTLYLAKFKVLGGETQNLTAKEGRGQNTTAPDVGGLKNASFARLTDVSNTSLANELTRNKLLDGLIAAGFEEEHCISRFQSYLYHKASPHKPSQYLISKLRKYEAMHKKCGVHTRAYRRTIVKPMRSKNHGAATMCKYLVWTAANGLGNRMISIAAAFLYALVTDRVLLVEFHSDMMDLFCEPFPNSTWILPKDFPFRNNYGHLETYQSMLEKDKGNGSEKIVPSIMHLNLQHTSNDPKKLFHCDHNQDLLQQVSLLILQSDQYFVPSLFMTPSFNPELIKMFPEKDTVFHHLGRYIFHPSNEAWGLISRYYEAHLAKANQRVGLQIRVYNTHRTPHQTVLGGILVCARKHRLLPELNMQNSVISPLKNQTLKAVLVASLFSEYGDGLRTLFMTKQTVTGELIKVYQPSHEERQRSNDNMHNIKAWTEIYLLSLCDALITSQKSTFGYVAQSLGGLKPWVLRKTYGETIPNPPCRRLVSMEPCFHYPPKHDCMSNGIVNITSLLPYIRNCEDATSGIKLVSHNH